MNTPTMPEIIELVDKLMCQFPRVKKTHHLYEVWFEAFKDCPKDLLSKAATNWIRTSTTGFEPTIGMISDEVRKLVVPNAYLTYQQAAAKGTPGFRKAQKLVDLERGYKPYNPYNSPDEMRQVSDNRWDEKRAEEIYNELVSTYKSESIPLLIEKKASHAQALEAKQQRLEGR